MYSPEELTTAPVINLELMLQPISEEKPSGESLNYSGLYDEIRESRRADLNLAQGDWQIQLKEADYDRVIELAVPALETQTKDLQIAAWLSEALIYEHGFSGLRDSLKLVSGIQRNFWETCYPENDEGDQSGRANAIEWLDREGTAAAQKIPITGSGLTYFAYDESKRFDIPENTSTLSSADQEKFSLLRTQAEEERRTTGEMWRRSRGQTRRAFAEQVSFSLEECWTEFNALNTTLEEKFDRNQVPGMPALKKLLDDLRSLVKKLLQEKREEEPDPSDNPAEAGGDAETVTDDNGTVTAARSGGNLSAGGAVGSRQEALKRLSEVADFFRKTEPHSPVSYLVQRAVRWGNMPLETWLQEVIKDQSVLGQLKETLGVEEPSADNAVATDSWSTPASSSSSSSSSSSNDSWGSPSESSSSDW